jgi:hypothetical protein
MKSYAVLLTLLSLTFIGCSPDKSVVCEGCQGALLSECEQAYESCDSVDHCRRSDLKRDFAETACTVE